MSNIQSPISKPGANSGSILEDERVCSQRRPLLTPEEVFLFSLLSKNSISKEM